MNIIMYDRKMIKSRIRSWLVGFFGVLSVITFLPASAQVYHEISRLGTSEAICSPGIETGEDLQAFFANNPQAVRNILSSANWSGDPQDLIDAVVVGDFSEQQYPAGTEFQWMSARRDNAEVALPYRRWVGDEPFLGFEVNVVSNCQLHQIVVPSACCNISLIGSSPVTIGECAPPEAVPAPTEVTSAPPPAEVSDEKSIIPFIGGFYGTETRLRQEPAWDKDVRDSSGLVGIKAGILSPINDSLNWFAQGGFFHRDGVNSGLIYPGDNYFADIGLEQTFGTSGFFLGGGVGIWNIDDSEFDDGSIFIHGGSSIGDTPLQWYIEGRAFFDDIDDIDSNKFFSAGVRFQFK